MQFLNELTQAPYTVQEQLAVLKQVDTLENNMSESWGVLSHLNAVMNNSETRDVYQALLPGLSDYYTQLGQHTALYQTYQHVQDAPVLMNYRKLSKVQLNWRYVTLNCQA